MSTGRKTINEGQINKHFIEGLKVIDSISASQKSNIIVIKSKT